MSQLSIRFNPFLYLLYRRHLLTTARIKKQRHAPKSPRHSPRNSPTWSAIFLHTNTKVTALSTRQTRSWQPRVTMTTCPQLSNQNTHSTRVVAQCLSAGQTGSSWMRSGVAGEPVIRRNMWRGRTRLTLWAVSWPLSGSSGREFCERRTPWPTPRLGSPFSEQTTDLSLSHIAIVEHRLM